MEYEKSLITFLKIKKYAKDERTRMLAKAHLNNLYGKSEIHRLNLMKSK